MLLQFILRGGVTALHSHDQLLHSYALLLMVILQKDGLEVLCTATAEAPAPAAPALYLPALPSGAVWLEHAGSICHSHEQ